MPYADAPKISGQPFAVRSIVDAYQDVARHVGPNQIGKGKVVFRFLSIGDLSDVAHNELQLELWLA